MAYSDDEDDTAELLAELQRIKKERAQEEAKKVWFTIDYPALSFFSLFVHKIVSWRCPVWDIQ